MPGSRASCCTIAMQPSKSVSSASTSEPFARGCTSCAVETPPRGNSTTERMPATAQYAARLADVSPVDAHATACMGLPCAIICLTTLTSTVMPRSLKLPVWLLPHSLIHKSSRPKDCPYRSAQNRLVPPSSRLTTLLSSSCGATHSFLPHTPLPYGQVV